ncbi:sentrin-specific protease 1-like isoform X2 [Bradysia coprophila]|nr:sentrin-specific protease 1-like isoform X2 [Bradysia coprophila]
MGSILSKFKSNSNGCEPTECEEYSDGEDVIIIQRFPKPSPTSPRHQPLNNYQFGKMDAVNNISTANRPLPGLIPKDKWSRLPNLHIRPSVAQPRVNGYQNESDTSSVRNHVVNGTTLSYKPLNSQHIDSALGKSYTSYMNSTCMGPKFPSLVPLRSIHTHNDAEDKLRFERMLKSAIPDYCVADPLPTSKRPTSVPNHIAPRPPLRPSGIHLIDDDLHKKREDVRQRFAETFITTERKTAPVNTMRMKTESSRVCQKQFPDMVKEKYSPAIAQRHEKISQQEKETKVLASIRMKQSNSYESLTPNWYTPSIVIFDEDIEDKIDDFPEFTDAQRQTIRQAIIGSPHTNLITKFNIQITRLHILTLQWEPTLAWLNDEVINFYMSLLTERGELRANDGYPKVYAMNTFFTQRLFQGGHSAVKRWTKKVDLFACDIIPVPVHVGNVHWCMAIINMKEKTIKYYDSMGAPNHRVLSELEDYLKKESLDKRKIEFDTSGWSKENVTDNPRQENGSDCGVFSCMTAEFICRNRPVSFNQQHMNYFRQRMVLEICTGSLLL